MSQPKTMLVTGATKGIGLATAKYCQRLGYQVISIARHLHTNFSGRLFCADLSKVKQTTAVLDHIQASHVIDGVANNIGHVLHMKAQHFGRRGGLCACFFSQ